MAFITRLRQDSIILKYTRCTSSFSVSYGASLLMLLPSHMLRERLLMMNYGVAATLYTLGVCHV
jgi:hypothetical protein